MKAAVQNGIVVDIHDNGYECHPSITWVDCDNNVKHGWTYNGTTFTTNEIIFTPEEKLNRLRAKRNSMLGETDWIVTMHTEKGSAIPDVWKTYREELRNITNSATSLDDVTWPEKP